MSDTAFPVAGVLDTSDNRHLLRGHDHLPGPDDVLVPQGLLRSHDLRRGDHVTGTAQPPGNGKPRLVRVETVNGREPGYPRPHLTDLTPVHPHERLRLETGPGELTTRVIDLLMPIGKGQRALIVAPPKAGKTTVLHTIAHAISRNHPECHLMAVLVGERPEEVTDFRRTVPGEVLASTFDQPPREHTALAELAVERAKRLAEHGQDVVVLLDSLTRLGRAYNLAAPASGRILTGGIDASALTPPKRFLGAARALEGGGSLTILATTLVDTGSAGDAVIFEEYKGTGNAELVLDRGLAGHRVFPAVDVRRTGTRKEELLLDPAERSATQALRRALTAAEGRQATEKLLEGLRGTGSNAEFLFQLLRGTPRAA
ncbi:transcription termination factor Rho [Crossiella equi]|uniref:Transcription termination factor Rho n=1 Tax=Crossiella equi TaxID=130796 RepID=A0ABS5ASD2_9PSEU|nr:transcription termination factor Rho [Crossiella equi]MBP2479331.1 transcription termination factor Rho [Crossiella equi]